MEEEKRNTSSPQQVHDTQQIYNLHACSIPGIQKDAEFIMEHLNDPNFDLTCPPSFIPVVEEESTRRYIGEDGNGTINPEEESPYPEVRAAVSTIDDPLMPVNTFRMWFLGIFFTLLISGFDKIFSMRYPIVYLSVVVVQLVCLPLGQGLAAILPTKHFNTFGYIWSLNPGPFSIKEHVCIAIMVGSGGSFVYSSYVILAQHLFYGQAPSMSFQILFAIGSQTLGFSFAGLLRQFVVWPSSMIWPGVLANCAFFNALHKNYGMHNPGHMTHKCFICIAVVGSFVWYWVPSYLFTGLSMFNWACWIAPKNVVINALFGINTGLGMSFLTFDWGIISGLVSPLVTPWWVQMNIGVGFLLIFCFIGPILYFTNVWNSAYFPIYGRISFDNTGSPYNAQRIITNGIFDPVKYAAYSPVFMPISLALTIGAGFATFPAVLMHTFLWYRKDIIHRFQNGLKDQHDIHSRLMQYYPEVPMWWYGTIGVISFAFLCTAIKIIPTQLPIWAAIIAILLSFIFSIPLSMLQAITNQQVAHAVLYEFIAGYILPGQPIANTIFKTVAYATTYQSSIFSGGLKLGHYMKIPPRIMFTVQIVASIISCIWVTFIQDWMLNNIKDICTPRQRHNFICPGTTTFATASVVFGAASPYLFSPGAPYSALLWFFLIGLVAPIPFYLLAHCFPLSIWRYINVPSFFGILLYMPQVSGIAYSSSLLCGFIFNYLIRHSHFRWWLRYNYILSAALDAGTAISTIVIFFTLIIPKKGGIELNWWGNIVWQNTADAIGTPFKPLPKSGFIGPTKWS